MDATPETFVDAFGEVSFKHGMITEICGSTANVFEATRDMCQIALAGESIVENIGRRSSRLNVLGLGAEGGAPGKAAIPRRERQPLLKCNGRDKLGRRGALACAL